MNIPKEKTIKLCDAERFVEGLKMLAHECNMSQITYNGFGPVKFIFRDGSTIGGKRIWIESGIIEENK